MTDTSRLYEKGGRLEKWNNLVEQADPNYGTRLFDLLRDKGIIPTNPDKPFYFLSVSANGGVREVSFAIALNNDLEHRPKKPSKTTVIASDIVNIDYEIPKLTHVNFVRLKTDANKLPITQEKVDVIYDRMGAIWYKIDDAINGATLINGKLPDWEIEEITNSLKEIFLQYKEKLSNRGVILLDDPDNSSKQVESTIDYLKKAVPDLDIFLNELGLTYRNIGQGKDRLFALSASRHLSNRVL